VNYYDLNGNPIIQSENTFLLSETLDLTVLAAMESSATQQHDAQVLWKANPGQCGLKEKAK
jgi:hypothetical protein